MTKGDILGGLIVGTILVVGGVVCVLGWKAMNQDPYTDMHRPTPKPAEEMAVASYEIPSESTPEEALENNAGENTVDSDNSESLSDAVDSSSTPNDTDQEDLSGVMKPDVYEFKNTEDYLSVLREKLVDEGWGEEVPVDVSMDDNTLIIRPDLEAINSKSAVELPALDLAASVAGSYTETVLSIEPYLWDNVTVDFGDIGKVSRSKLEYQENEFGGRYFIIETLD